MQFKIPIFGKLQYDTHIPAFIFASFSIGIAIAFGYLIDEALKERLSKVEKKHRYWIKFLIHFIQGFASTFISLILLYVLFGYGAHHLDVCSMLRDCPGPKTHIKGNR